MDQEVSLDTVMTRRFELVEEAGIIAGRHKAELAPLNEEIGLCEAFIKSAMNEAGMQQCKTSAGMAFFTTKTSCTVEDFDATVAYIKANEAWNLLNRAVNKTAVAEYIEANNAPPPGVRFDAYKDLSWRKGKS